MFCKRFPVVFRPPARQLERGIDDGFQNASDSLVCLQLQSIRAIAMPWKNYTKLYIFYDSSLWQSGHCHSNIGEQQEHPLDEAIKASNRRQRDLKTRESCVEKATGAVVARAQQTASRTAEGTPAAAPQDSVCNKPADAQKLSEAA
jgi:hypothetical protein